MRRQLSRGEARASGWLDGLARDRTPREFQRIGAVGDAALLTRLATDGVCTMQAAAAHQRVAVRSPRTDTQLRNSFNHRLFAIKLATACRMYGVAMPAEREGYHVHAALYDAELAGRLYFAMRGIAYGAPVQPGLIRPTGVVGRSIGGRQ